VKDLFSNSMKDVQTMTEADIDLEHTLLFTKICTKLKQIITF
jgi:hypothetical protein